MSTTSHSEEEFNSMSQRYSLVSRVLDSIYNTYSCEHNERLEKCNDEVHYPFIPKSGYDVIDYFYFLKEYFKKHKTKYWDLKFLDIGCGVGNILMLANDIFETNVWGIERDKKLSILAGQFLRCEENIFNLDASNFKNYQDYDIIYYYCPIQKKSLEIKLESLIEKSMKKGAYLIPF